MQSIVRSGPVLEALESRLVPSTLTLTIGDMTVNLGHIPVLENGASSGLPGAFGGAPGTAFPASVARLEPFLSTLSLLDPAFSPSVGPRSALFQAILNPVGNNLGQPFAQPGSSGTGTSPFGPTTGPTGTPSSSQGAIPNFFFAFAENGSTGGQVAVQPGFNTLIPNFFLQPGSNTAPQTRPLVDLAASTPLPPPETSPPPLLHIQGTMTNAPTNQAGSGDAANEDELPKPLEIELIPAPQPDTPELPPNGDSSAQQQLPLVPEDDLVLAASPQTPAPANETERFWGSFAGTEGGVLLETAPPLQQENTQEAAAMLAPLALALISEWMPRKQGFANGRQRSGKRVSLTAE